MIESLTALGFPVVLLAFVVFIMFRTSSPVLRFLRAKACSPATARRPASVGIEFPETLSEPLRTGLLVSTGDGRYYVNREALRRIRRRRNRVVIGIAGLSAALLVAATLL